MAIEIAARAVGTRRARSGPYAMTIKPIPTTSASTPPSAARAIA